MTQKRKRCDGQFKIAAAKVVLSGEATARGLSEELGIKDPAPRRWAREHGETGDAAFPGNGSPEINEPKKKAGELERENGMPSNFRAFSSRDRACGSGPSDGIRMGSAPSGRPANR